MTSSLFFLAAGIRPSSVTAEIVSCAVTSMDFFDRLQEQGEGLFFFQVIKKEFLLTKSIHYQAEGWWEKRWKYEIWNTVYLSTKISQIIRNKQRKVQKIDIYISEVQLWKRYFYRHSTCIRFCLFTLKLRVSIILIQKVLWENQETSKNVLMSISKTMLFLMNLER